MDTSHSKVDVRHNAWASVIIFNVPCHYASQKRTLYPREDIYAWIKFNPDVLLDNCGAAAKRRIHCGNIPQSLNNFNRWLSKQSRQGDPRSDALFFLVEQEHGKHIASLPTRLYSCSCMLSILLMNNNGRSKLTRESSRAKDASKSEQFLLAPVLAAECIHLESIPHILTH